MATTLGSRLSIFSGNKARSISWKSVCNKKVHIPKQSWPTALRDQQYCHQLTPGLNLESLSEDIKETMALHHPLCLLRGSW